MIKFENVVKRFGDVTILDELNLEIEHGKTTFIIGKSGEGKSVTIKHIIGLLQPTSGKIYVGDRDITKLTKDEMHHYRRQFGILFQHAALFDSMSVGENVLFPLRENTSMPFTKMLERVEEVLTQLGLPHIQHKNPSELSTGEKKRVGLARALATKPQYILYDEPTTGMDPLISEMLDALILKVNQEEQDLTSIVISHDLKAAMAIADTIIMLYKGKVALAGTPDKFKSSKNPVIRQFFSGSIDGPMEFI